MRLHYRSGRACETENSVYGTWQASVISPKVNPGSAGVYSLEEKQQENWIPRRNNRITGTWPSSISLSSTSNSGLDLPGLPRIILAMFARYVEADRLEDALAGGVFDFGAHNGNGAAGVHVARADREGGAAAGADVPG